MDRKHVPFPDSNPRFAVGETRLIWHDERRNRDVPVTIYGPQRQPAPVVVVSHGIGEDRDSYAYLGRALAANGFLAVHVTHAGTDRAVLEGGYRHLYAATKNKENWIARPLDVSFVLDQLENDPRADMSRVAVVGHSAGAFTAFALAGIRGPDGQSLRDPRVKVVVPMSMPRIPSIDYDGIAIPVLNITGTCDTSLIYRTFPRHRRIPFDETHATRQSLITLRGVNHDTFSNRTDPHHDLIAAITVAFLRAYLLDDTQARAWFDEPGRTNKLTVERK